MEKELNLKKLMEMSGMNMKEIASYFEISYNSLQNWVYETRKPPEYLLKLMLYKLEKEGKIKK